MAFNGADLDQADYDGRTPLHLAASEGRIDIVKYLISFGIKNMSPVDRWQNTPLDDAVRHNHVEIKQLLEKHGAVCRRKALKKKLKN